jgi:predicted O-methyltransferase YrrM
MFGIPINPPSALYRRPTLLNWFHFFGLAKAHTQTNSQELACLYLHSHGHKIAVEIGTYEGVSACVIAKGLLPDGQLYCVDPWPPHRRKENPSWTICRRELRRQGVLSRVVFVQRRSQDAEAHLPQQYDFIFVDADHSYEGLEVDWGLVVRRLTPGGIVCLHDTAVPVEESWLCEVFQ